MNSVSEFCRRMQAALNKRQRADTVDAKAEAEREMADLIRSNFKQQPEPFDHKRAAAGGDREE